MSIPLLFEWLVPHWWASRKDPPPPDERSTMFHVMNTSVGHPPQGQHAALIIFKRGVSREEMAQALIALEVSGDAEVEEVTFKEVPQGAHATIQIVQD